MYKEGTAKLVSLSSNKFWALHLSELKIEVSQHLHHSMIKITDGEIKSKLYTLIIIINDVLSVESSKIRLECFRIEWKSMA
jgi:hypothetical protein